MTARACARSGAVALKSRKIRAAMMMLTYSDIASALVPDGSSV
jgi:hypothetical protein